MTDWSAAPVFGVRERGQTYTARPSAYGIVERGGSLALVRTPEGVYLPGGGIEAGETPEQAMVREAFEECGLHVRPGAWRESAIQFAWAQPEKMFFEKRSVFLDAAVEGESPSGTEPDHELFWMRAAEAARALTHEAHGWAVRTWTARTRP